jgi:hypothetical protein
MVFVSFSSPFLRRFLCALTASIGFIAASGSAKPLFFAVTSTPYDRQMTRVRPALIATARGPANPALSTEVSDWMMALRALPYRFSRQWKTPTEIRFAPAADCKGKALALYAQMQASGARNVWFVIGKHHANDWVTHAWVQWVTADGTYVLDPTFNSTPTRLEPLSSGKYVPLYAYEGPRKYRAAHIFVAQN